VSAIEVSLALLLAATLIVAFAPRLSLPLEAVLVLGSLLISFVPGLPPVQFDSNIVFFLFLPPILFAAAYFTSWRDFKANSRPIGLLAIGLVLFTMVGVAWGLRMVIPGLSWPIACAFGALISPPDASAATAITRKLGVPRRLLTIIEGESLVNDATALVAYRFAIAAAVTGEFSPPSAAARFLWVGAGGVIVGLAVGMAGIWLYKRLGDGRAQVLTSFLAAFVAYSAGENLHVSGVISTVAAGLTFGRWIPNYATAESRIEAKASWDLVLFVINGLVFTLIGLELPQVVRNLDGFSVAQLSVYAVALSALVIAIRFVWVFPATYIPRWLVPRLARRDPAPSWKVVSVLSYTGMRGIVSLAAALALPVTLPNGDAFPHRNLLIFLTYTVILTTLLLPSLTLPSLLRWMGIKAGDEHVREEILGRITAVRAVLDAFSTLNAKPYFMKDHLAQVEGRYRKRLGTLESNLKDQPYSVLFDEDQRLKRLLADALAIERKALIGLRKDGKIHDEVFHLLSRELDLEDLRLRTQRF
jgi:CPA1 family monovalent cation:H+ antiporter